MKRIVLFKCPNAPFYLTQATSIDPLLNGVILVLCKLVTQGGNGSYLALGFGFHIMRINSVILGI